MTIRPVAFVACYMLGTLILWTFFLLDEIYFRSVLSKWHIEVLLVLPLLWFAYSKKAKKMDVPECTIKLLAAFLVFFSSVYAFLPLFFPDFKDHSWPEATAQSIILLTSFAMTLVIFRHFNKKAVERKS